MHCIVVESSRLYIFNSFKIIFAMAFKLFIFNLRISFFFKYLNLVVRFLLFGFFIKKPKFLNKTEIYLH